MPMTPPRSYFETAARWFGRRYEDLDAATRRVVTQATEHRVSTETPQQRLEQQATLGERLADRVAQFGGSWTFIMIFALFLFGWAILNSEILGPTAFDPYPYIFLNLMLSMLAAIQAPIIMMSQNRQSAKDRQMAGYDYEVNLKSELEILALHEKFDALRAEQIVALLEQQRVQIELLTRLVEQRAPER